MRTRCLRLLVAAGAVVIALTAAAGVAGGCNTMRGLGKDISNASEDIEYSVFGDTKSHSDYRRR